MVTTITTISTTTTTVVTTYSEGVVKAATPPTSTSTSTSATSSSDGTTTATTTTTTISITTEDVVKGGTPATDTRVEPVSCGDSNLHEKARPLDENVAHLPVAPLARLLSADAPAVHSSARLVDDQRMTVRSWMGALSGLSNWARTAAATPSAGAERTAFRDDGSWALVPSLFNAVTQQLNRGADQIRSARECSLMFDDFTETGYGKAEVRAALEHLLQQFDTTCAASTPDVEIGCDRRIRGTLLKAPITSGIAQQYENTLLSLGAIYVRKDYVGTSAEISAQFESNEMAQRALNSTEGQEIGLAYPHKVRSAQRQTTSKLRVYHMPLSVRANPKMLDVLKQALGLKEEQGCEAASFEIGGTLLIVASNVEEAGRMRALLENWQLFGSSLSTTCVSQL